MTTADDPDEYTRELAANSSPTGWFEELYARAQRGGAVVPWDRGTPHDLLVDWVRDREGAGEKTLVVAPGGTLLVIAAARDDDVTPEGPLWPLTRDEIMAFATAGLTSREVLRDESRWRAEFRNGRQTKGTNARTS